MRHRPFKFITVLLALLLAASSWAPTRAEAQMRCAGASPTSAPCARAVLPAAGLSEGQVYGTLMACCLAAKPGGCALMRHPATVAPHPAPSALGNRRCSVTVRVSAPVPAGPRTRLFLPAFPALAPPAAAPAVVPCPDAARVAPWTYTPVLSPHAAPVLHGLRAPPVA